VIFLKTCHSPTGEQRDVGDGRQSGTSGSPSILNVSPAAAYQRVAQSKGLPRDNH
jgi:hypothetical protein